MSSPTNFRDQLAGILDGLYDALAGRAALAQNPVLLMLVCRWVRRLRERADRLVERLAAGEVLSAIPPAPRRGRANLPPLDDPSADAPGDADPLPDGSPDLKRGGPRLPVRWAWIVQQEPETMPYGLQLLYLLFEPDMQAFLQAAPEIGPPISRLLRLLAISPPDFLPPESGRRVRSPRPHGPSPDPPALPPSTAPDLWPSEEDGGDGRFPASLTLEEINRPFKNA